MSVTPFGVYIHFPWCVRKCPYCDFNSHPLKGSLAEDDYVDALLQDIAASAADLEGRQITTVFFGGGTPSLFSPRAFERILEALPGEPGEITLEANPGTAEYHAFADYRAAGINRLSLGAQSFSNTSLQQLGRIHAAEETLRAFEQARTAGFTRINLDLMYGLPGQSVEEAMRDLEVAADLFPEHLSWYELTLEPKTEFHQRPPVLPDEDTLAGIEDAGRALLGAAGYQRYEVSAWSQPGMQSQHNLNYWRFGDYAGFGAGAHGKLTRNGRVFRTTRPAQPRLYMSEPRSRTAIEVSWERLRFEYLLNVLRLPEGASFTDLSLTTGLDAGALDPEWRDGVSRGLLRQDRVATTPLGYRYLDGVLQTFL